MQAADFRCKREWTFRSFDNEAQMQKLVVHLSPTIAYR